MKKHVLWDLISSLFYLINMIIRNPKQKNHPLNIYQTIQDVYIINNRKKHKRHL